MTNPHDTDAPLNPNVQWPYLSLATAPLAAFHQALVQTGDYTGDRKKLHALGGALGDTGDKAKYESVKPTFQKVKDDSLAAEKFLGRQRPDAAVPGHGRRLDRSCPTISATSTPATSIGIRRSTTCPRIRPTPRCAATWTTRAS